MLLGRLLNDKPGRLGTWSICFNYTVYATDARQGEVSEGIIHFNTFHSCCRWSKAQCSPPIKAMLMPDLLRWEKSLKDSEGPRFFIAGPQPNRFTKQRLELCLESEILSS